MKKSRFVLLATVFCSGILAVGNRVAHAAALPIEIFSITHTISGGYQAPLDLDGGWCERRQSITFTGTQIRHVIFCGDLSTENFKGHIIRNWSQSLGLEDLNRIQALLIAAVTSFKNGSVLASPEENGVMADDTFSNITLKIGGLEIKEKGFSHDRRQINILGDVLENLEDIVRKIDILNLER